MSVISEEPQHQHAPAAPDPVYTPQSPPLAPTAAMPTAAPYRARKRGRSTPPPNLTARAPGGSLKLGTLAGIEIRVHYTWLLAFVLVAWSLGQGYFLPSTPGQSASAYWILGLLSALLLFGSVLVHELAHSLVAVRRGLRVRDITLFIFGGSSNITSEASSARDEFLISVVGPLASLALAGLFWLLAGALPSSTDGAAVANYLTWANLLLAAAALPNKALHGLTFWAESELAQKVTVGHRGVAGRTQPEYAFQGGRVMG